MKVLLACEIFPPDIGGPATYAMQLGEALQKAGHSVRVITYGEVKKVFLFPVIYVSRRTPFFLRQFLYLLKLLRSSRGIDLIYAQGPSVGPAAVWAKWLRRYQRYYDRGKSDTSRAADVQSQETVSVVVKYVGDQSWQQVRVRGDKVGFEEYMKSYGRVWRGWKIWFIQRWQKFSLQNAGWVVVPSQYLKHVVVDYLEADEKKVAVIPNGVEARSEMPQNQSHCEKAPDEACLAVPLRKSSSEVSESRRAISGSARINEIAASATSDVGTRNDILFVGRLENWKGLDTLVNAVKLLPPDFTLTLLGDGSERENLELRVTSYELRDRIKFVGRVPHSELERYFLKAFCLVEGTEYEGMPHVVLESWSFGVPVIVSDFPANMELVKDGKTGLVFRLGDAQDLAVKIQLLASDQTLYQQIRTLAFEEHKKYDKNSIMKETIEFLQKISNSNRHEPRESSLTVKAM